MCSAKRPGNDYQFERNEPTRRPARQTGDAGDDLLVRSMIVVDPFHPHDPLEIEIIDYVYRAGRLRSRQRADDVKAEEESRTGFLLTR